MSSPEQIFLSYLGSELHATQLSLSTMWIPPNPACAPTDLTNPSPMWAQALTVLPRLPISGLSLHRVPSSLFFCSGTPYLVTHMCGCFPDPVLPLTPFSRPISCPCPSQYRRLPCLYPSNDFRTK